MIAISLIQSVSVGLIIVVSRPAPLVEKGWPEVLLGGLVDAAEIRDSVGASINVATEDYELLESPEEDLGPVAQAALEVGELSHLVSLVEHDWNVHVRDHVL